MQNARVLALCLVAVLAPTPQGVGSDPMGKVFEMMDELKGKIIKDGEAEAKAYKEFFDWCDDVSSEKRNEITTETSKRDDREATIKAKISSADASSAKIEELAASIAQDSAELKDATAIREKEAAEFAANEEELVSTIDTLSRAVGVLEKEMAKNAAAFAQMDTSNMNKLLTALRAIVGAASFRAADKQRLLALVQAKQSAEADDDESGAPAAAAYKSQSGGVFDLLEDLKEEAEDQLSSLRKEETTAAHNYAKLKQSLEDSVAADTKADEEEKASKAAAEEARATAEGELETAVNALKAGQEALALTHSNCIQTAADHEKSVTSRTEELNVIEQAKKILKESTGGAVQQSYSLFQVAAGARSTLRTRADLAQTEVVAIVKKLAKEHHSAALTQLVSRITAVARYSAKAGADPFVKIKKLIEGLISKLQEEGAAAATEKAYCDEQMSKTEAKKAELEEDIEKLTTKIDKSTSKSASLKEEVNALQAGLAALAKEQAELDQIRSETHEDYAQAKSDLEAGLAGVRKALEVLRDYYGGSSAAALLQDGSSMGSMMQQPAVPAHSQASGAGGSIISILEVCESDFASGLAKEEMQEADAETEYQAITQENKVTKLQKEQDAKYKTKSFTGLDKAVSDLGSDLATENSELGAVLQYYGEVKDRCVAVPDSYEEQAAKREAEIKGLKQALSVLESETAFVQRRKQARGSHHLRVSGL